jgi:hypothetical protein
MPITIKAGSSSLNNTFSLSGLEFIKDKYELFYEGVTLDRQSNVSEDKVKIGIRSTTPGGQVIQEPVGYRNYLNLNGDRFVDLETFLSSVMDLITSGGGPSAWGVITGTLSNQTDLQAALDAKSDTSALATVATSGSFGDLTGTDDINNRVANENKTIEVLKTTGPETLTAEAIEVSTGADVGKKPFLTPDVSATTIDLVLGNIGDNGDLVNFSGNSLKEDSVLSVEPDYASGVQFLNLTFPNSGFTVEAGELAVARKISSQYWRVDGSFKEFKRVYSPSNLYTESSVVNADSYAAVLGSWVDQGGGTNAIQVSAERPFVAGGSQGSIRFFDDTPSTFERAVLPFSGLSTSNAYEFRFYWRRVQGTAAGLQVEASQSGGAPLEVVSAATSDTGWSATPYVYTFTPTVGSGEFRLYGDYNAAVGTEEFYITNIEIIQL